MFWEALARDPAHEEANEALATHYVLTRERGKALHFVEIALARDPDDARNHENQGLVHELDGRAEEAIACFDRALARDPKRTRAAVGRGRCLLKLGRRGEAEQAFARALEATPQSPFARLQVAEVYLKLDEPRAAYDAIAPALTTAPEGAASAGSRPMSTIVAVRAVAGACLFRMGRPGEGEPLLREVLQEAPEYAWARRELGQGLLRAGLGDKALAFFEEERAREPEHLGHVLDAADALLLLGRKDDAVAAARSVLDKIGAVPELVRRVAKLAHDAGRFAEARAAFEEPIDRALDKGRVDRPLVRAYGAFLADIGDTDAAYVWARSEAGYALFGSPEALSAFEELKKREPNDVRHELGCILAIEAIGAGEQAFERSLKLLEETDWSIPRLLRRHAELGLRTGVLGGSPGKVFEQALDRHPDDVGIMEALVQYQVDHGHGDSHYAVWWKKKLDEARRKPPGVAGGGAEGSPSS
jgi:tetratricopeptide (TPR) repeat protein